MEKKYLILTYGCQMNERDSEVLAGNLREMGYQETQAEAEADLIVVNTCCVRESAENKIYGKLGSLKRLKQTNPELLIAVCGCMAQQEGVAAKIRRRAPHIDIIFGTHNSHLLPKLVAEAKEKNGPVVDVWEIEGEVVEDLPSARVEGAKAYVTIMYGCNNFCSYCIVPYVRGRERSRRPEEIESEVAELAGKGYLEVTLLGQNVNSYGKDLCPGWDFADLLARLDRVSGIARFRYMTSHPRDFSDKLIKTIASSTRVCEHFHLPIQAGSNRILSLMNRGYTREYYLDLVAKIREAVPRASITTDFIVGFPGETEADFEDTLALVRRVGFDAAYTFLYSKRSGTPAAGMPQQVTAEEKKVRLNHLMAVQNEISLDINRRLEGETMEVLVEGESRTDRGMLAGRTRTNKLVLFPRPEEGIPQLVPVEIREAKTWTLHGLLKISERDRRR